MVLYEWLTYFRLYTCLLAWPIFALNICRLGNIVAQLNRTSHFQAYLEAVEKFTKENPDAARGYTTNAWWEGEEYQKSRQRSDERAARVVQAIKDERTLEVEAIAKEWVKREYFRQSMAGTISDDLPEEEFSKTVWERALLEGDIKYRVSKGEKVDEAGEVATFQSRQERKQQAMEIIYME